MPKDREEALVEFARCIIEIAKEEGKALLREYLNIIKRDWMKSEITAEEEKKMEEIELLCRNSKSFNSISKDEWRCHLVIIMTVLSEEQKFFFEHYPVLLEWAINVKVLKEWELLLGNPKTITSRQKLRITALIDKLVEKGHSDAEARELITVLRIETKKLIAESIEETKRMFEE